jgi:hypothetical protein
MFVKLPFCYLPTIQIAVPTRQSLSGIDSVVRWLSGNGFGKTCLLDDLAGYEIDYSEGFFPNLEYSQASLGGNFSGTPVKMVVDHRGGQQTQNIE